MTRVLITGATGVVGHELLCQARLRPDWDVVGSSARGDAANGVVAWRLGEEPAPEDLRRGWDVVVNSAGRPKWNLDAAEAYHNHVHSLEALADVIGPDTNVVHVSTAFAIGRLGSIESEELEDYHNTYEWSKAAAERTVAKLFSDATIVRPPLVIGRRSDGGVARFTGMYSILRAVAAGQLPALVAKAEGLVEAVPVDDLASWTLGLAADRPAGIRTLTIGRGPEAIRVDRLLDLAFGAFNAWRVDHGVPPLDVPKLLSPDQWQRFFLPFARPHLTFRQLKVIELLSEFEPYLATTEAFEVQRVVDDISPVVETVVRYWADACPHAASRVPKPWRGEG